MNDIQKRVTTDDIQKRVTTEHRGWAKNLNIDIEFLNPFEGSTEFSDIENPAQYAVAFGCAIRGLVEAS